MKERDGIVSSAGLKKEDREQNNASLEGIIAEKKALLL